METATGVSASALVVSVLAFGLSGWNFYDSSLAAASITYHVAPVLQYSTPDPAGNLEHIEVPITIVNDGAKPAVIAFVELTVIDGASKSAKGFFVRHIGRRLQQEIQSDPAQALLRAQPFAPIAVLGKTSRTEVLIFANRLEKTNVARVVTKAGCYSLRFKMHIEAVEGVQLFGRAPPVPDRTLQRSLPHYNRSSGPLPMYENGLVEEGECK